MQNYIYVQSASGKPLMPTTRTGHVRRLLNAGKARIVCHVPFVIRLTYETPEEVQPLFGGTDPGRTNIGEAVLTSSGDVVLKAHVETNNKDVPKHMAERKQHRQASRRGERLVRKRRAKKQGTTTDFPEGRLLPGYDEPVMLKDIINTEARVNNRKRPAGWLTPTTRQLVQTHLNMVIQISRLLPVTDWTLEINRFAFMAMDNGSYYGVDFTNGRMKGYPDAKSYVAALQEGKCAVCDKPIDHFHHIKPRSQGGSNLPENLVGLCKQCHETVHLGKKSLAKLGKQKKYDALSVLNQAIPYILNGLIELFGEEHVHTCFGWQTEKYRDDNAVAKEHSDDAVCIAAIGAKVLAKDSIPTSEIKQYRKHDRQRIHAQYERTYYTDPQRKNDVCKNRHKRFEQKCISLEEYRAAHPDMVPKLFVKKSVRHYNNPSRPLPGTTFLFAGKRYIMSGQSSGGKYLLALGYGRKTFSASKCKILQRNAGLVWL